MLSRFMRILFGSVHVYYLKAVLGSAKSTIATWEGSIDLSLTPSASALKVASSTRVEIADRRLRHNLASGITALNILYRPLIIGVFFSRDQL